jgi:hypothetical protein
MLKYDELDLYLLLKINEMNKKKLKVSTKNLDKYLIKV